jgi:hypothetical protein
MMRSVGSWEGEEMDGEVPGKDRWDGRGKGELDLDREEKGIIKARERERESPSAAFRLRGMAKVKNTGKHFRSRLISIPGVWLSLTPSVHSHLCPCQYGKGKLKKIN